MIKVVLLISLTLVVLDDIFLCIIPFFFVNKAKLHKVTFYHSIVSSDDTVTKEFRQIE